MEMVLLFDVGNATTELSISRIWLEKETSSKIFMNMSLWDFIANYWFFYYVSSAFCRRDISFSKRGGACDIFHKQASFMRALSYITLHIIVHESIGFLLFFVRRLFKVFFLSIGLVYLGDETRSRGFFIYRWSCKSNFVGFTSWIQSK